MLEQGEDVSSLYFFCFKFVTPLEAKQDTNSLKFEPFGSAQDKLCREPLEHLEATSRLSLSLKIERLEAEQNDDCFKFERSREPVTSRLRSKLEQGEDVSSLYFFCFKFERSREPFRSKATSRLSLSRRIERLEATSRLRSKLNKTLVVSSSSEVENRLLLY